jgi:hypothetical protein
MAEKILCDICNEECNRSGRYGLYYSCLFYDFKKQDICYDCIDKIRQDIKKAKVKRK